jgi:hypothetical protein
MLEYTLASVVLCDISVVVNQQVRIRCSIVPTRMSIERLSFGEALGAARKRTLVCSSLIWRFECCANDSLGVLLRCVEQDGLIGAF